MREIKQEDREMNGKWTDRGDTWMDRGIMNKRRVRKKERKNKHRKKSWRDGWKGKRRKRQASE